MARPQVEPSERLAPKFQTPDDQHGQSSLIVRTKQVSTMWFINPASLLRHKTRLSYSLTHAARSNKIYKEMKATSHNTQVFNVFQL